MSDYESRLMDMDMVLHEKNKEIQKYKEVCRVLVVSHIIFFVMLNVTVKS